MPLRTRPRSLTSPLRTLITLALVALALDARPAAAPDALAEPAWRVLVLHTGDVLNPLWLMLHPMMRKASADAAAPRTIDFVGEALDLGRFPNLEGELVPLLEKKYADQPIDLLVTVGDAALDFALNHRDRLWRSAPIVFLVVPQEMTADVSRLANVTGVHFDFDADDTLKLVARLQPQARRLVVAGGNSQYDLAFNARLLPHAEHVPRDMAVEYVNDRTADDLLSFLSRLSPSDAVLYTSMSRDASGATRTPRDVAARIASASGAPVYAMVTTMLGQGIVGGSMASLEDEATIAGKLIARVLRAGSANGIPIEASPQPRCMVDFRAITRWNIPERAIPDDCTVLFVPPAIWREYPRQVAAAAAAIALLVALVIALLVQRRQRLQADLAVQQLRTTLFHAARLTAVGELSASIAHEINQPLGAILSNADAARMIIEKDPTRTKEVQRILADIRADDLRAGAVIRRVRGLVAKRETEHQRIDVNELAGEVLALLRHEAARRNITTTATLDPALPAVLADRVQLQQVLLNLLLNAMDATAEAPAGQRQLAVTTATLEDGSAELSVADRGHGIAAENFTRLFDSFWSTKAEGMGLGLTIVKSIMEAHGGSVRAENNADGGATFRVVLPAAPAVSSAASAMVSA